uniref:TonB-dependent siderophore receptor n=1 Tax=Cellvibrio fontiphilus TaxID=1815559 RepID=UPI002B4BF5D1|nr:TonB-dependent receptor [Cellvibrio fontiphilus]
MSGKSTRFSNPFFRPALLSQAVFMACLGGAVSFPVFAQTPASAQAETLITFDIPAGSLDQALNRFASTAGVMLAVDGAKTKGLNSAGLQGQYTVSNGFAALLAETGLQAVKSETGSYALRDVPKSVGVLKTVKVTANAEQGVVPYVSDETTSLGFKLSEQKTPAIINTVTEAFWEATASKTLDEVLSYVPGINLTDNGGWTGDTIAVRGFLSSIPFRDGMRQVDSGYGQSLRSMPDNIERIEIVKGPAGAEFGVAEPGGAVNFVTKKPERERSGSVSLGAGQDGYRKLGADFTGALNQGENLQGRLVLAYVEPEEWRAGRPDDTYRYLVAPSLNWDYSEQGKVTLGYERNHQNSPQDRGIIYVAGAWPDGFAPRDWSFHQTTSSQVNETERWYVNHRHGVSDSLTWTTAIQHSNYEYQLKEFRNADTEPGWGNLYLRDGLTWSGERLVDLYWDKWRGDTDADSFRSTLEYSINAGTVEHVLSLGIDRTKSKNLADSLYSDVSNTLDILAPDNHQRPQILREDYALWESTIKVKEEGVNAKWLANWSERWRTIMGLRRFDYSYDYDAAYTDFTDSSNDYPWVDAYGSEETSVRLATSFDLNAAHTLFAGFSDGYVPQGGVKRDGTPLDAIHDRAFELGIKSRFMDGKLSWTNSLFETRRTGMTLNDPQNGPDDAFAINGGKGEIHGIESELNAQLGHYWLVRAGLALQESRIAANDTESFQGNRFANTPERQVSLTASYDWEGVNVSGLTTDLCFTHISQRWGNSGNNISLPGYTLVNLGAAYQIAEQTSLRLSIANATDETYYTGMQDSGARADQVMVGSKRNAFLTLSQNF